jgi:hypothetical protein
MKIIIAGGRNFNDYDYLVASCDSVISSIELKEGETIEIVCGLAAGADKMGEAYAESRGYPVKYFPAQWHFFGNSAGYKRNVQMAEYADGLIAFWDGESRGTMHMINIAKEHNIESIKVFNY